VIASGEVVVDDGDFVKELKRPDYPDWMTSTVDLKEITPQDFIVEVADDVNTATVRTIVVEDGSLATKENHVELDVDGGEVQIDPENDILKAIMFDRHEGSDLVGQAFVEGYGLEQGAVGFSVNASRENVVVLGTNDEDMITVVKRLDELQGGIVTVEDGEIIAEIPMPLLGLQSHESAEEAVPKFQDVISSIHSLGCDLSAPLASLEFICVVPQIPSIRLSEYGLFDLDKGEKVDLVLETN
jgi:adenine deaminase